MKKHILSAVAVAALSASAAMAQSSQVQYDLSAEVDTVCTVNGTASFNSDIDFGELLTGSREIVRSGGGLNYRCNSANGFTRTIASANGGSMLRGGSATGAGNELPFEMSHGGGSGLGTGGYVSLTSPIVTSVAGSTAFIAGQTGSVNFRVTNIGNTLFAGNYSDTVTVSVVAN
jgi:spore coat protein U-like protein